MGLFDQINTAENFNEDATKEKHVPTVKAEKLGDKKYKVHVDVGAGKHPNEMEHWIQWAELQVNDLYVARAEFSAAISDPVADFIINCAEGSTVSVLARCNKHGLWKASVSV